MHKMTVTFICSKILMQGFLREPLLYQKTKGKKPFAAAAGYSLQFVHQLQP